jgi:hypothetical protein
MRGRREPESSLPLTPPVPGGVVGARVEREGRARDGAAEAVPRARRGDELVGQREWAGQSRAQLRRLADPRAAPGRLDARRAPHPAVGRTPRFRLAASGGSAAANHR